MNLCKTCLIPTSRPDTAFVDGVCSACLSYQKRQEIDWPARRKDLELLLERGKNSSGYDCIVPSSGGKDSHYQVLTLLELGAKPLVVTATTCHLTKIGRLNIDNLARYATTIEVSPNKSVRAKLNRLGLEMVGDISWPEHASIFTVPFRIAVQTGIPLIFYGESPQNQYGGPPGTEEARQMTVRWVSEFGGFNGLRAQDLAYQTSAASMRDYELPPVSAIKDIGIEAHFLGQYLPWDSHDNALKAMAAGMMTKLPSQANYWPHENLDNAQTGIHDYFMWLKYGLSRAAAQLSVDIRSGDLARDEAYAILQEKEAHIYPHVYGGMPLDVILTNVGITRARFDEIANHFSRIKEPA